MVRKIGCVFSPRRGVRVPCTARLCSIILTGLSDLAAADRETVVQRIAEGRSAAEAEAEFLTDEYFEAWYQDICAKLAQYEG